MTTLDLLHEFEQLGVSIWREGDALKFDAPTGTMTPERINLLKQHKPDLLAFLSAGNATIEPLEHRNDGLTARQQKSINILKNSIEKKRNNLIQNGYLPDNAKVKRTEWREAVMRTLFIQWLVMDELEDELWRMGAICYSDMHVVLGDWTPKSKAHTDNADFILSDNTGRTFCIWYDSLEGIH
jgi:hypothetical protein